MVEWRMEVTNTGDDDVVGILRVVSADPQQSDDGQSLHVEIIKHGTSEFSGIRAISGEAGHLRAKIWIPECKREVAKSVAVSLTNEDRAVGLHRDFTPTFILLQS